jgi:hypothetical protein
MQITIHSKGAQQGPFPAEQIQQLLQSGAISPADLGWSPGMAEWKPLSSFPELQNPSAPMSRPRMGMPPPVAGKPHKVTLAVRLLYSTLGLGIVRSIWEFPIQAQQSSAGFVLFVIVFTFVFVGFFVFMIDQGKNWARITFLVLFVIGVPLSIYPLLQSLAYAPVSGVMGLAQVVLQTLGIIFLFQKDASVWFKKIQ